MSLARSGSKPELALGEATRALTDLFRGLNEQQHHALAAHAAQLAADASAPSPAGAVKGRRQYNSVISTVVQRTRALAVLMILQSFSGFILDQYSSFIESHMFVTLYLTMLVGAGGNAGNQSAVNVIRGLATGEISRARSGAVLWREARCALLQGAALTSVGFWRVYLFQHDMRSSVAISLALFSITSISVIVGAILPLGFDRCGLDPAHAGPAIQVVMDVTGVYLTCTICSSFSFGGGAPAGVGATSLRGAAGSANAAGL